MIKQIKLYDKSLSKPRSIDLDITPEMATELLKYNTHNRPERPRNSDGWAKDMQAGKWRLNGETLKFAFDGRLLDGQNRLRAVTKAGVSAPFTVFYGLPHDAQDTTDVGNRRTFADTLKIKGYGYTNVLAGITRHTFLWAAGERRSIGHGKLVPTNIELMRHLDEHPELTDISKQAAWQYSHFRGLSPTTQGLGIYLFDTIDTEERRDFFLRLIEGANMEADHPIMALRKDLLQRHSHLVSRLLPEQKVAMMINAWNAYREGRRNVVLRWKAGGKGPEKFPEPR